MVQGWAGFICHNRKRPHWASAAPHNGLGRVRVGISHFQTAIQNAQASVRELRLSTGSLANKSMP